MKVKFTAGEDLDALLELASGQNSPRVNELLDKLKTVDSYQERLDILALIDAEQPVRRAPNTVHYNDAVKCGGLTERVDDPIAGIPIKNSEQLLKTFL